MARLKLSAAEWSYFRGGVGMEVYARLKAAGFDGVEMVDPARWAAAKAAGLKLVNIPGPGMENGLNRVENHAELLPAIREKVKTAAANGIEQVIVFSGCKGNLNDEEGMANCVRALKELAPAAADAGVMLVLELLNTYDHKDYHCASAAFAFGVAERVNSPAVKVLYDIYHAQRMGEDPAAVIAANVKWIGHLHVAGSPKRDFPGEMGAEQAIDYRHVVQTARAAGYDGWWGMEFMEKPDAAAAMVRAGEVFGGY